MLILSSIALYLFFQICLCFVPCISYCNIRVKPTLSALPIHFRHSSLTTQNRNDIRINNNLFAVSNIVNESVDSKVKSSSFLTTLWNFSRPHTLIGSALSILSLYSFASNPINSGLTHSKFWSSILKALIPSLFMNLYITGLNQLTDIEIDKINKPYLPLASGELSYKNGLTIVITSLVISLLIAMQSNIFLQWTIIGSGILGTLYSLPPFRLKRYPLLAAFCILVVRGSLVNLGFYLSAKVDVMQQAIPSLLSGIKRFPESAIITCKLIFYCFCL